jgi:hypothetical protein
MEEFALKLIAQISAFGSKFQGVYFISYLICSSTDLFQLLAICCVENSD